MHTDNQNIHREYLRAVGAVTRYVQQVRDHKRPSNSNLYRTLQTRANELHREVYGKALRFVSQRSSPCSAPTQR